MHAIYIELISSSYMISGLLYFTLILYGYIWILELLLINQMGTRNLVRITYISILILIFNRLYYQLASCMFLTLRHVFYWLEQSSTLV